MSGTASPEDYTPEYIYWDFRPYTPVRTDSVGEVLIMQHWQKLVSQGVHDVMGDGRLRVDKYFIDNFPKEYPVLRVLDGVSRADERATRVAATFIRWLATPMGSSFLEECERAALGGGFSPKDPEKETYLGVWERRNRSDRNNKPRRFLLDGQSPTVDDWETMDNVALWLGSAEGKQFIGAFQQDLRRQPHAWRSPVPTRQP